MVMKSADLRVMSLCELGEKIADDWDVPSPGAAPYLSQMHHQGPDFGDDEAHVAMMYFLVNARGWSGPVARQIKAELRHRVAMYEQEREERKA